MLYKYGKRTRESLGRFYFSLVLYNFGGVFNKTIIPLTLVGYEMIRANSAVGASLAIYHLVSNAHSPRARGIIVKLFAKTRQPIPCRSGAARSAR